MHKVFMVRNDFLAKIFYLYLSSGRPLNSSRVSFQQFFEKLMPLWPMCDDYARQMYTDELTQKRDLRKQRNFMVFNILNLSRGSTITLMDLLELCAHFPESTMLG